MSGITFTFIVITLIGALLFLLGFIKKSVLTMFFGLIALLASFLYFIGWTIFLPFVPPVAMGIAYLIRKSTGVLKGRAE